MCQAGVEGKTAVRMEVKGSPSWGLGPGRLPWRGASRQEAGGGGIDTEGEGRSGPMYRGAAAGEGGRDRPGGRHRGRIVQGVAGLGEKLQFVLRVNRKLEGCSGNRPMAPRFHILSHVVLHVPPTKAGPRTGVRSGCPYTELSQTHERDPGGLLAQGGRGS